MLNRDEPRFLLSFLMWGDVNWRRFTTAGKVGTGATVLVCQGGISKFQMFISIQCTYRVSRHVGCMWREIGDVLMGAVGTIGGRCGHHCRVSLRGGGGCAW